MRILGIDPGTVVTGYGIIESHQGKTRHLDNGGIFPPKKAALIERIHYIFQRVMGLIEEFHPDAIALENIFIAKNVSSTLKLGHARGAIMIAVAQHEKPFFEYTANQVKQAVCGYGHASKEQIQKMVKTLLKLPDIAFQDASDALAVAICHSHSYKMSQRIQGK